MCQKIDPYARPSISEIMGKFLEMESRNNHSGNRNEWTIGQINSPAYWEDDMLGVQPLELRFGYNTQTQILSCSVELSNDTDGFIAFKIQTTSPLPYSIEPNNEIVKPWSKLTVDISMHVANAHDLEVAHQYSNKQYNEFIVRSIKVSDDLTTHDIFEDMFDKHTTRHHVDEIHLVVASEEPCIKEVFNLPNGGAKKGHTSSGTGTRLMSSPTKRPGSVKLVVKKSNNAPLLEYEKKVMLELTAGDYTSDRLGLDLVVVLDVSSSMHHGKMDQLKKAMRFVVQKLSPVDRFSIVAFSYVATKLCSLRQITDASQRELQELINGLEESDGVSKSNIKDGLLTGLKVLADSKVNGGRVGGVMVMSNNGHMNISDVTQLTMDNVPVYTFGFGASSDTDVLSLIAAKSMGGTFSHIQDIGDGCLTMAFSQCLAGLLSVSVRDLELTMAAVGNESRIVKVTAGSYPQTYDGGSVAVRFGDLYSSEVRNIIVDISVPAVDRECSAEILKVTYSYSSRSLDERMRFVVPSETLTVWRSSVDVSDIEKEKPVELQREEVRLQAAKMIKTATTYYYARNAYGEQLLRAQILLKDQSSPRLTTELRDLVELCKTQEAYDEHFRAYALSSESSHGRQRFAARGHSVEVMRLFATPLMDRYLEEAKKFHKDTTMPLPPSANVIKEEVSPCRIDVASREEEMGRLSLEMED